MVSVESELLKLAPENERVENLGKTSYKRQYFATFCVDLLAFSYGASCGWPSASIPILKSDLTPLKTGPISSEEASWITSGICLGGFVGNLLTAWVKGKTEIFFWSRVQNLSNIFENSQLGFNFNRPKTHPLLSCTTTNFQLDYRLLLWNTVLFGSFKTNLWSCWRRLFFHSSFVYFRNIGFGSQRHSWINFSFLIQSWNFLFVYLRRICKFSDDSMVDDSR